MTLKEKLDLECKKRNCTEELCEEKPDPLMIATRHKDEYISLICALFAYGNAGQIVKLLDSLDFDILRNDLNEDEIRKRLEGKYYRFQTNEDIVQIFLVFKKIQKLGSLEDIFYEGYSINQNVLDGIEIIIKTVNNIHQYNSHGYDFFFGKLPKKDKNGVIKYKGNSPYKRYNMFLRWMIRDDNIDLGLWKKIDKKDLILPLDTHTFKVSQQLGLVEKCSYDLNAAILVTNKLKEFDILDPIKYDFAIYRLGQEKINL
jgi:uncharacterized protein (TIGR02757 family)